MLGEYTDNGGSVEGIALSSAVVGFDRRPGAAPVKAGRIPRDSWAPGWTHAHDFLVLFYAHRADGRILLDGRTWTVSDGDLFVIAPGQVVSFISPHDEVVEDGWTASFPADVIRPAGAYPSWRAHPLLFPFARGADRAQRLRVPPAERAAWFDRFAALDAELRDRHDGHHEAALAHLTLLLVATSRLTAGVPDELRAGDEPLLAAVFELVEQRFHEPVSLSDLAAELSLTPGHLTTVVRRKTGRTVQQWLTQRRMQQARRLLADTDLTVAAISHRVGYPDVSYFIRRFRTDHDMTPAQWRAAG
ncbi:AraC family transcriptional regulator [Actinoplanes sp. NBC_00393]|uniref:helix-turn-helix transcriptional regulator n=1 Tax=Actinoplanes sp. NBC_00393 TaxID=2975953 RepID=UPI002E1EBD16